MRVVSDAVHHFTFITWTYNNKDYKETDKMTLESNWKITLFNVHGKPMKLSHKHFAVAYV
jgi:hypothetical protein